jgi:epoxyqueuosine reductase
LTIAKLQELAAEILGSDVNCVTAKNAVYPSLIGLRFYDNPVFGIADANDPLFETLREPGIVGKGVLLPKEVLPSAKSVISWFLPFTQEVRKANGESMSEPSDAWRQARMEGQDANFAMGDAVCKALEAEGSAAVQVSRSNRFQMLAPFCSNWSERHVAYIAGLGTFGLSKGLITEKGMAGRFGSVVTDAELPPTQRPYQTPFEYCIMCGACAKNCPVAAIDPSKGVSEGKDHKACKAFCDFTEVLQRCGTDERKRYGCGKCQVNVPCEFRKPDNKR